MNDFPRREFLASSLGALASLSLAAESSAEVRVDHLAATPRSLFLTWWTDPTTTMVIQWIGPDIGARMIGYAPLGSSLWRSQITTSKPFPDTRLYVHRCELRGLTPGAEYQFCIDELPRRYRFRTMPAKATNTIQFVSGGDCGTGSHVLASNKIAALQEPHFVLLGGDLAYDNGNSPKTFIKFLENYSQNLIDPQGRLIPMVSVLGNHEVNGSLKDKRKGAAHYLSVFDGIYNDTSFGVLDIGDYLSLVLLDSGHISPVRGEQTSWLHRTLSERQERPHLLVANHVPAYPSYRAPENTGKENRDHWCPLFERFKVDAVLEHHDHTFKRTHPLTDGRPDKNGVLYLGDGSWGRIRALDKPEKRPYLATYGSAYHISVHRLEGDQRYHVALDHTGKLADVCMTHGKRPSRRG